MNKEISNNLQFTNDEVKKILVPNSDINPFPLLTTRNMRKLLAGFVPPAFSESVELIDPKADPSFYDRLFLIKELYEKRTPYKAWYIRLKKGEMLPRGRRFRSINNKFKSVKN